MFLYPWPSLRATLDIFATVVREMLFWIILILPSLRYRNAFPINRETKKSGILLITT